MDIDNSQCYFLQTRFEKNLQEELPNNPRPDALPYRAPFYRIKVLIRQNFHFLEVKPYRFPTHHFS